MEKEEIVKIFLKEGIQIDKESLDYFSKNEELIQDFLQKCTAAGGRMHVSFANPSVFETYFW